MGTAPDRNTSRRLVGEAVRALKSHLPSFPPCTEYVPLRTTSGFGGRNRMIEYYVFGPFSLG
jgi:hypothetical protein